MKRILILMDMEGIIGVTDLHDSASNTQLVLRQLTILINELVLHGHNNITVFNIHDDGRYVAKELLPWTGINYHQGIYELPGRIRCYDVAILIGFHCKKDSPWPFSHSFRKDFDLLLLGQDEEVGEIGAYTKWLSSYGIDTIFISGIGAFSDEIAPLQCDCHCITQPINDSMSLSHEYERFRVGLLKSIRRIGFTENTPRYIDCRNLRVYIDNEDKYYMLNEYYDQAQKCFLFPSLSCFFNNLVDFSQKLNEATSRIIQENSEFAKFIKRHTYADDTLKQAIGEDYLRMNMMQITQKDRDAILDRLESWM